MWKAKKNKKTPLSFKNTHRELNTKNENNWKLVLLEKIKIRLRLCPLTVPPWNNWHEMATTRSVRGEGHAHCGVPVSDWIILSALLGTPFVDWWTGLPVLLMKDDIRCRLTTHTVRLNVKALRICEVTVFQKLLQAAMYEKNGMCRWDSLTLVLLMRKTNNKQ